MCACMCSVVSGSLDCSPRGSSVHGISRQEFWSGLLFPTSGDLPDAWIELISLASPVLEGGFFSGHYLGS